MPRHAMPDAADRSWQRSPHRVRTTVLVGPEDGSLVTEYGLVAVLGATVAGLAIKWASGGAIFELLGSLLAKVKVLVGA